MEISLSFDYLDGWSRGPIEIRLPIVLSQKFLCP